MIGEQEGVYRCKMFVEHNDIIIKSLSEYHKIYNDDILD